MQPRHCLSASSTRREEVAQARDTAGQWRSTRKARRSLPQPAAACAQATTCFWESTHVHPWFQSPKPAMAAASGRPDARTRPDWSTPGPHRRHFPRLGPSPAGTARRAPQELAATSPPNQSNGSKKRQPGSRTRKEPPPPAPRIEPGSYKTAPRRKRWTKRRRLRPGKRREIPGGQREKERRPGGSGGRRQLGWIFRR